MTRTRSYTEEAECQRTSQFVVVFPAAQPGSFPQGQRPLLLSQVVTAEGESQQLFSTRVGAKASEEEGRVQRQRRAETEGRALHTAGSDAGGSASLSVVSYNNNNTTTTTTTTQQQTTKKQQHNNNNYYYYYFLHGCFLARVCPWRLTNATVF